MNFKEIMADKANNQLPTKDNSSKNEEFKGFHSINEIHPLQWKNIPQIVADSFITIINHLKNQDVTTENLSTSFKETTSSFLNKISRLEEKVSEMNSQQLRMNSALSVSISDLKKEIATKTKITDDKFKDFNI